MLIRLAHTLSLLTLLAGCASTPQPAERLAHAAALAAPRGWTLQRLPSAPFALAAFAPSTPTVSPTLTVYLEGDGLAWIGSSRPSDDPTPIDPLALRLALAQPDGAAAYLARPCQYVTTPAACEPAQWTMRRFGADVIAASNQAIDLLKQRFHASTLTLVGYSGGAAVALLLASRRADVMRVITVAGNVDHAAWTRHHHMGPLTGSLDPAAEAPLPRRVRQFHFAGDKDLVIPAHLVEHYTAAYPVAERPTVRVLSGFDHHCCWAQAWPRLWSELPSPP